MEANSLKASKIVFFVIVTLIALVYAFRTNILSLLANSPPMFETKAQKVLSKNFVSPELISKLIYRHPLTSAELIILKKYRDPSIQFLLASNPGADTKFLAEYSSNLSEEGWWGLVSNHNAPKEIVLSKRTIGSYSTTNSYIARNSGLSSEILMEMYHNKEALDYDFAINRNVPESIAEELLQKDEIVRIGLAINPSISESVCLKLKSDPSELVRRNLIKKCGRGGGEKEL